MNTKHCTPDGYTTVTPWIISQNSVELIRFLEKAFGGEEIEGSRMLNADGSVGHVEVKIGTAIVMLFDARKTWPKTPGFFRLYVKDADAAYDLAIKAGARPVTEVTELFWGDRVGRVCDPFGNIWWLQTHAQDVPYDQMQKRMEDPEMIKAMEYVQQSLAQELNSRNTIS